MERRSATETTADATHWWWIFDPRISLRARATLVIGGGALLFIVLLGWLAGAIFRRQLTHQTGPEFETLAFQVSDKIDRALYERYAQVQLIAGLAPLRSEETSRAERRRLLDAVLEGSRDFAWLGFADASGRVVSGTQGWFENTSVAGQNWFRAARDKPYAGSVHEIPELARWLNETASEIPPRFIDFARPVSGPQGQFLGILCGQVRWNSWPRDVQLSVIPETASRDRLGVTVYASTGDVLLDSGGSGWTAPLDAPAAKARRGSMEENFAGMKYITGYARSVGFREFRGFGWLVTVRQPVDVVLAPARELQRAIVAWGILLGTALVAATWIAAARLARRLGVVAAAARRIRGGDILATMPRSHGDGEVDRMCGAVSAMVEDFRAGQEKTVAQPPASETRPW